MSSKINLQTCEYARKSSIFQDNQLISDKCIMFFLLFYTFVAFTVLRTKTLALFVILTLKQRTLFRAIFNLPHFFWLFLLCPKIFSVSSLNMHNRPMFLRRARKNVSLPARRQPPRLPAARVYRVRPWTPPIFPAFFLFPFFLIPPCSAVYIFAVSVQILPSQSL